MKLHKLFQLFLGLLALSLPAYAATSPSFTINSVKITPTSIQQGQTLNFSASFTANENVSGYHVGFIFFPSGSSTSVNSVIWNTGINFQANVPVAESSSWIIPTGTAPGTYTVDVDVWDANWTWVQKTTKTFVVSPAAVNGACGTSNGASLTSAPSAGLCSTGVASAVGGSGPWTWSCAGSNGGTNASCSASLPKACVDSTGATHVSGSAYTLQLSKTSGSIAATKAQCLYGGTQATTITTTQAYLCTNGVQAAQGNSTVITANNGSPVCNAGAACGSTPSGSTVWVLLPQYTSSTSAATAAQCPYGGTVTTTYQDYHLFKCDNGTLTYANQYKHDDVVTEAPVCKAPAACGSTPSGSTVTNTVSTTTGSIAATTTQCPYGGIQATTTTVTQVELCTNGTLSADGNAVSTTVDSGNPACNPAPVAGVCGTSNGTTPSVAPTTNLCSTGISTTVSGSGPWTWSCAGSNGGTTASCSTVLASRNVLLQPFSTYSIWNVPIGSSAVYQPANITPPNAVSHDDDVLILTPTAPLTNVAQSSCAGWSGCDPCSTALNFVGNINADGTNGSQVPFPAPYVEDVLNSNLSGAVLLQDGQTLSQFQPVTRCTENGPVVFTDAYGATGSLFPNGNLYADGRIGAHGGSGLSAMGGTIRVGELEPGKSPVVNGVAATINHALKFEFNAGVFSQWPTYTWPALRGDGAEEGLLLALLPTFDYNSLQTPPARSIAWTLINYGAYIVDNTGWNDTQICFENYSTSDAANGTISSAVTEFEKNWGYSVDCDQCNSAFLQDMEKIMANIQVITNNSSACSPYACGPVGGGAPRQPLLSSVAAP